MKLKKLTKGDTFVFTDEAKTYGEGQCTYRGIDAYGNPLYSNNGKNRRVRISSWWQGPDVEKLQKSTHSDAELVSMLLSAAEGIRPFVAEDFKQGYSERPQPYKDAWDKLNQAIEAAKQNDDCGDPPNDDSLDPDDSGSYDEIEGRDYLINDEQG